MPTKPASVKLVADRDRAGLGVTEYNLEYRGEVIPADQVTVRRVQDRDSGEISLWIIAVKINGKPVLNNSQMDAIARHANIPKVGSGFKSPARMGRTYYRDN